MELSVGVGAVYISAYLFQIPIFAVGEALDALQDLFVNALLMPLSLRVPQHVDRPRREYQALKKMP